MKIQVQKYITNYLFQAAFFVHRIHLQPKKFIYALLRLAEKAAENFLKPAVNQKKYGLGV